MFEIKRYQQEILADIMSEMEATNHLNDMYINGASYSIARAGATGWLDEDVDREKLLQWAVYEVFKIGWCDEMQEWQPYELCHPDKIYCTNVIRDAFGDKHIFELHTERWAKYIEWAIGYINDETMGAIWEWYADDADWPQDVRIAREILEGKLSADEIVAWFFKQRP